LEASQPLRSFCRSTSAGSRKRYLDVRVSLEEHEIWEVVRGVEEGRADIGVCWDAVDVRGRRPGRPK
jgi:hypothetical protein